MRRALCIATLALAATASPAAADGSSAKARMLSCQPALDQPERSAGFAGDMRTIPGASRLQIKFVLQARTEDEPDWTGVATPGFGTWNSSAPGIKRYVYTKRVENLVAPASYRVQVHFRWLSAGGRTLLRARRTSRVCRQPDLRPDLVPLRVTRAGNGYEVTVANDGGSVAESFTVTIEVGGQVFPFGYVEALPADEEVRLQGEAPACQPGSNVVVRVDADGAVDEADEEANVLSQACPHDADQ